MVSPTNNLSRRQFYSNHIVAYVRSISGPAVEKPPQDNQLLQADSFTYRIYCVNAPVATDTNIFNWQHKRAPLQPAARPEPARAAPDVSLAAKSQRQARHRPPDLPHARRRPGGDQHHRRQHPVFLPAAIVRHHQVSNKLQIASCRLQVLNRNRPSRLSQPSTFNLQLSTFAPPSPCRGHDGDGAALAHRHRADGRVQQHAGRVPRQRHADRRA